MQARAADLLRLIPESLSAKLTRREQLLIGMLLIRADEQAHERGKLTERKRWQRLAQKGTATAA